MRPGRTAFSLVATALFATSAAAQDVILLDDEEVLPDGTVVVEEPAYVEEYDDGPRVLGWTYARPLNCGVFRYWNGVRCADARFEPPPLD